MEYHRLQGLSFKTIKHKPHNVILIKTNLSYKLTISSGYKFRCKQVDDYNIATIFYSNIYTSIRFIAVNMQYKIARDGLDKSPHNVNSLNFKPKDELDILSIRFILLAYKIIKGGSNNEFPYKCLIHSKNQGNNNNSIRFICE